MPRTTLDLEAHVLNELRRRRDVEGKPMGQLASELLAIAFDRPMGAPAEALEWESAPMGRPVVDLEDKDAVSAILDQR